MSNGYSLRPSDGPPEPFKLRQRAGAVPLELTTALMDWAEERATGNITLHIKDGRVLSISENKVRTITT